MNNSKLVVDRNTLLDETEFDRTPVLQDQRASLVKTIEAIQRIAGSDDWRTLKEQVFDGVVESLERRLRYESLKEKLNDSEIHSLQGQLVWARKYSNLKKLADFYKGQLKNVKQQLHGKEEGDGAPNRS